MAKMGVEGEVRGKGVGGQRNPARAQPPTTAPQLPDQEPAHTHSGPDPSLLTFHGSHSEPLSLTDKALPHQASLPNRSSSTLHPLT